ncbi:MAG TPA: DUF2905 domain-containing protein [Candidatus Eisenbacteria bacterium]|jgi:hypothetical protein|nr:DUF2905 domain-containing protein [Candidatus Eisenbacteria bacterium]
MNESWGRVLLVVGAALFLLGAVLTWGPRMSWLGRLPGDFRFGGDNWKVYIPLGTSLLLSVVLSLIFWALRRR